MKIYMFLNDSKKKKILKKIIFSILLFLPFYIYSYNPYIEIKTGYTLFQDNVLRKIFDNGGINIQGEIGSFFKKNSALSLNYKYFSKKDYGLHSDYKTEIKISDFTLYYKYILPYKKKLKFYLGLGPKLFFFENINHSPYVTKNNSLKKFGGGIIFGCYIFNKKNNIFIDPSFDYGLTTKIKGKKELSSKNYQISINNFNAEIGIGYKF